MSRLNQKDYDEVVRKRQKLKQGIDDVKKEHDMLHTLEKVYVKHDKPPEFFPFTHGDHIERQREMLREELKYDMQRQ